MARPMQKHGTNVASVENSPLLPISSRRVVTDCLIAVGYLVQRHLEGLVMDKPNPDGRISYGIRPEEKLSMRTLSEDAWAIFQSITNLFQYRDASKKQHSADHGQKIDARANHYVHSLSLHLEILKSRLRDAPNISRGDMSEGMFQPPVHANNQMTVEMWELNTKIKDTFKAAHELTMYTDQDCPLKRLSRVLTELDSLLVLADTDTGASRGSANDFDNGGTMLTKVAPSSLSMANYTPSKLSNAVKVPANKTRQSPKERKPKSKIPAANASSEKLDAQAEPPKDTHDKVTRRGKHSDTLVRTSVDGIEVVQIESLQNTRRKSSKKKGPNKSSTTSCKSSESTQTSSSSIMSERLFSQNREVCKLDSEERYADSLETDSVQEITVTEDLTNLMSTPDSNSESMLMEGEENNVASSQCAEDRQSNDMSKDSLEINQPMDLDRRASITDLQECHDEETILQDSSVDLDVPFATNSCPAITTSPSGTTDQKGLQMQELGNRTRHKSLTYFLYVALGLVVLMAFYHMTVDMTNMPSKDDLDLLLQDFSKSIQNIIAKF